MEEFARTRNEIWFMDLAYNDKLAKYNNGVNHLLELFDRTVDAKEMKTKDTKYVFRSFLTQITKKIDQKRFDRQGNRRCCRFLTILQN